MRVFLVCLVLVALCVVGLCFNIIFRKNGEFPQFDVGSNEEMRKRGIRCMREIQDEIPLTDKKGKVCSGEFSENCIGCSIYKAKNK